MPVRFISAAALLALMPLAIAQGEPGHHDARQAANAPSEKAEKKAPSTRAGCEAMTDGTAGGGMMDHHGKPAARAQGHMQDGQNQRAPMMEDCPMQGDAMPMMERMQAMSPEECRAHHEAMGRDPAENCPMMGASPSSKDKPDTP